MPDPCLSGSGKGCADGDAVCRTRTTEDGRRIVHRSCPLPRRVNPEKSEEHRDLPSSVLRRPSSESRKEVIQPQVPLRLPCYDFTPVADLTVVGCLPKSEDPGLAHRLRVKPTPMV